MAFMVFIGGYRDCGFASFFNRICLIYARLLTVDYGISATCHGLKILVFGRCHVLSVDLVNVDENRLLSGY
jgi:hypothetical protein